MRSPVMPWCSGLRRVPSWLQAQLQGAMQDLKRLNDDAVMMEGEALLDGR
jgi:hypothetical protein